MFSRTSAGMSVLAARFESGSPGASANTENTTRLITSSVGIAIRSRRRAYVVTLESPLLPLADVPGFAVERTQRRPGQILRLAAGERPVDQRHRDEVLDDHVVQLLPHRRGLVQVRLDHDLIVQF